MRRPFAIALLVVAFLLAGCGASSGENSSSKDKSSDTSDEETTTTAAPEPVSADDLESILPTASDIGDDYRVAEPDDEEDDEDESDVAAEEAMNEACPEAAELDQMDTADDSDDDSVSAKFETEDDRGMEVSLDPTPDLTEDEFNEMIDALASCGEISWEDEAAGSVSMSFEAEPLDGYGDFGAQVNSVVDMQLFGIPISIDFTSYMFMVNGVGVSVTATGGLDPETFEGVPSDSDLVPDLASEMQTRVEDLTD